MLEKKQNSNFIRTMVRGLYDLQKMRIQMGNRITGNFKAKLGFKQNGMTEKQLEKEDKKVLDNLRISYRRITDGIVDDPSNFKDVELPSMKKFKGDEIISSYAELVLVDQYMRLLSDEERNFRRLGNILKDIPIYTEFLEKVSGIGPAIAAVIISEIDIHLAEYSSSLWMYAGLDTVNIGVYTNGAGKECVVPQHLILESFDETGQHDSLKTYDGFDITYKSVGRSRKDFCLVQREYITKDGEKAFRSSITYNPFLKTKLIGVLGTSFLRSGTSTVDGKKTGNAKRLELAISYGFNPEVLGPDNVDEDVIRCLINKGHTVIVEPSKYGKIYYDYKNRLENSPAHTDKSPGHRHNMAIRYMVKRFLVDLYAVWRKLENLPVAEEYAVAKLGLVHGVATKAKEAKAA